MFLSYSLCSFLWVLGGRVHTLAVMKCKACALFRPSLGAAAAQSQNFTLYHCSWLPLPLGQVVSDTAWLTEHVGSGRAMWDMTCRSRAVYVARGASDPEAGKAVLDVACWNWEGMVGRSLLELGRNGWTWLVGTEKERLDVARWNPSFWTSSGKRPL